jgi:hypothetical protein
VCACARYQQEISEAQADLGGTHKTDWNSSKTVLRNLEADILTVTREIASAAGMAAACPNKRENQLTESSDPTVSELLLNPMPTAQHIHEVGSEKNRALLDDSVDELPVWKRILLMAIGNVTVELKAIEFRFEDRATSAEHPYELVCMVDNWFCLIFLYHADAA